MKIDSLKAKIAEKVLFLVSFIVLISPEAIMSLNTQEFARNSFQFGVQMYKHLPNAAESNVIYSPLSIQTCLTMAFLAAKGKTAEEMATTLSYLGVSHSAISDHFLALIESFEKEEGLKIANKIYVMDSYKLKADFNARIEKNFKSAIASLNFGQNVQAAGTINAWVEAQTNNRIKDLISPDALNSMTRAVLVNAIYFKGKWKHQFDPRFTQPLPFWTTPETSINVPTMTIKKKFRYGELPDLDARALELPYADSNITMLIVLPNQRDGLKTLEKKLETVTLDDIDSRLRTEEVEVFLPKFEFEYQLSLTEVLKDMGIKEAFDPTKADFSGLLESPEQIYISDVVHKAFIKVDEEGAEAAAATVIEDMGFCYFESDDEEEIKFRVDHPFMTFFETTESNLPLFRASVKSLKN